MAIATFKRKEIKFLINDEQFEALIPAIEEHMVPDFYCVGGREYGVYNIYYDTADSYLIRESLAKPYYKEKIRLRSYFSPAKPDDTVFLEIKKKIGGVVAKRRVVMTLQEAEKYLTKGIKPETDKYIQQQVFSEIDAFLRRYDVAPAQYISYQRYAFFGKYDNSFRLTFDREITERRKDLSLASKSYGNQIILPDQHLMEVKISNSVPMWLCEKLAELKIYKTSFSKYGRAYATFVYNNINKENRRIKTYA